MLKMTVASIITGAIVGFLAYCTGYVDGMKSKGKCQIRIGGKNNTQVMK